MLFHCLANPKAKLMQPPSFAKNPQQGTPVAAAKSATAMGNVIAAFGEEGIKLFPFAAVVS